LSPQNDCQALALVAHKIKGAARIAQASRVIECCDALEQACNQSMSADEIARRCAASNQVMLELEQALQQQLALADQGKMTVP
jgi:two-component system sensor histidine kinase EvgS